MQCGQYVSKLSTSGGISTAVTGSSPLPGTRGHVSSLTMAVAPPKERPYHGDTARRKLHMCSGRSSSIGGSLHAPPSACNWAQPGSDTPMTNLSGRTCTAGSRTCTHLWRRPLACPRFVELRAFAGQASCSLGDALSLASTPGRPHHWHLHGWGVATAAAVHRPAHHHLDHRRLGQHLSPRFCRNQLSWAAQRPTTNPLTSRMANPANTCVTYVINPLATAEQGADWTGPLVVIAEHGVPVHRASIHSKLGRPLRRLRVMLLNTSCALRTRYLLRSRCSGTHFRSREPRSGRVSHGEMRCAI